MKRPGWIWVISIYYLLSISWSILALYLALSGTIPTTPAQRAYFQHLTALDWAISAGTALLNSAAALLLFLLRKQAVYLFASGLACSLFVTVWHALTKGWLAAMPSGGLAGSIIGLGLGVSILIYASALSRRGVLT